MASWTRRGQAGYHGCRSNRTWPAGWHEGALALLICVPSFKASFPLRSKLKFGCRKEGSAELGPASEPHDKSSHRRLAQCSHPFAVSAGKSWCQRAWSWPHPPVTWFGWASRWPARCKLPASELAGSSTWPREPGRTRWASPRVALDGGGGGRGRHRRFKPTPRSLPHAPAVSMGHISSSSALHANKGKVSFNQPAAQVHRPLAPFCWPHA